MKTGWRDLIVTSHNGPLITPQKGNLGDIGDFGPRYENKSSLSLEDSSRNSIQQKPSPISPEPPTQQDWLTAWREVAAISSGLVAEDPRLPFVMAALGVCDVAFEAGDFVAFQHARDGVLQAMGIGAFSRRAGDATDKR